MLSTMNENLLRTLRFTSIVNQYKDRIFTYSFYFLGNRHDAEDVSQEVLLKVWQHLDDIKLGSAKAWVLVTTRNLCIDFCRRRKRQARHLTLAAAMDTDAEPAAPVEGSPLEIAQVSSLSEQIAKALLQLPETQRSVLIMREIQDLSYRDISKALEIPLNSIKVYIMRGRMALKAILEKSLKTELKNA